MEVPITTMKKARKISADSPVPGGNIVSFVSSFAQNFVPKIHVSSLLAKHGELEEKGQQ